MSDEQLDELLRNLVPINNLAHHHQTEIVNQSELLSVKKGRYLFKQGDKDPYSFYLLEGEIELAADGTLVKKVRGGSEAARMALAQLQPRQMSAKAVTTARVLRVDRGLLDRVLTLDDGGDGAEMEVAEIDGEEPVDWMTRMLQSELFARIPAANIQGVFARMEEVEVTAGERIVEQGTPGDYYYVVQRGRCAITRRSSQGAKDVQLAELAEGDSFGEEALVSDSKRNASVSMLTDGALMRLTKNDFVELIKKPALRSVDFTEAERLVGEGARWLDVRFPDELAEVSLEGALNVPLNVLRIQNDQLDRGTEYVVVCDSGTRSASGAFLLTELGFDVAYLSEGLRATPLAKQMEAKPPAPAPTPAPAAEDNRPAPKEAKPAPKAPAPEKPPPPADEAAKPKPPPAARPKATPAVKPDPAPAPAASSTPRSVEAEVRASALSAELAKAKIELEEAWRARADAEARATASQSELTAQIEAERENLRSEAAKASEALREAQRLRIEALEARRAAEQQARSDEEGGKRLEEALAQKVAAEEARRQAEDSAKERIEAERHRREEETARAEQALKEAQRLSVEIEAAKRAAEEEARRLREEQEARIREIEEQAERRLRENEQKLQAEYSKNAEQLSETQKMREQMEANLTSERDRIEAQAAEARKRLEEARQMNAEVAAQRRVLEREAKRQRSEQEKAEVALRAELDTKLREERRKLERQFAQNAEELEQVKREKDAAEAAGQAAKEEAKRIISEHEVVHRAALEAEEKRLEAERAAMEVESKRIEAELADARRAKEESEALRLELASQSSLLQRERDAGRKRELEEKIAAIEERVSQANDDLEAAERAQQKASADKAAQNAELDRKREETEQLRRQLELEAEEWLKEQNLIESGNKPTAEAQSEELRRIKDSADKALSGDKATSTLFDDVASQLADKD